MGWDVRPFSVRYRSRCRATLLIAALGLVFGCDEPLEEGTATEPPEGVEPVIDLASQLPGARLRAETRRIDFGTPEARAYLEDGWAARDRGKGDSTGIWGIEESSAIRVFLSSSRRLELVFRASPFSSPDTPRQRVTVEVNGKRADRVELGGGFGRYRVEIPDRVLHAGDNLIRFHYRYHRAPAELTASKDRRPLAVFWDWIELVGALDADRPSIRQIAGRPTLEMPAGSRIDYFLELPAHSGLAIERLRSSAAGGAPPARLEVEIEPAHGGGRTRRFSLDSATGRGAWVPFGNRTSSLARVSLNLLDASDRAAGDGAGRDSDDPNAEADTATPPSLVLIAPEVLAPARSVDDDDPRSGANRRLAERLRPRNRFPVVVYLIDTLRADHLGSYGYPLPTSPQIDRFAEDSVLFARAVAQSSWTRSATASLLTGLYPRAHTAIGRHNALPAAADTLAERLQRLDYATAGIATNGNVSRNFGFAQGFQSYESLPENIPVEVHQLSDRLNQAAFAWLDRHLSERPETPFFLYLHATDPHAPYTPREPFRERFARAVEPEAGSLERVGALSSGAEPEPGERDDLMRLYDGEIAFNDHHFGALLSRLKRLGLYREAMVVLVSDHGEEFYDHDGWQHGGTLFQEQLGVPLIVKLPGNRAAGKVVTSLAEQVDLVPTILDLLGEPVTPGLDGTSLLPAIAGSSGDGGPAFAHLDLDGHRLEAVVESRTKLIRPLAAGPGGTQLYDLVDDPDEQLDLSLRRPVITGFLESLLASMTEPEDALDTEPAAKLSPEMIRQLRALGYLD